MTFAIPFPENVLSQLRLGKYYLLVRIYDKEQIDILPQKIACTCSESFQSWQINIKNRGAYTEGLWGGLPTKIYFSVDGIYWTQIFAGYVSTEGLSRQYGYITDDIVTLNLEDRTRGKGTRRTPSSQVLAGFTISDPFNIDSSLLHKLASNMGVTELNCGLIDDIKDVVTLGDATVWQELQSLQEAYNAYMYFDYLGRLFFHSEQESGWSAPEIEWCLNGDPKYIPENYSPIIGKVSVAFESPICNKAKATINKYEHLSQRVIYRNTDNWNKTLEECSIEIPAGGTWPTSGVASLKFKDPDNGNEYDYATDIVRPSIGQNKNSDIAYIGGILEIVSFDGSTPDTTKEAGAVQILLKNSGGDSCRIFKFEVRGNPLHKTAEQHVEEIDSSITDDVDFIDKEIDGKYGTSVDQIDKTLAALVAEGKSRKRKFQVTTTFLPFIQRGMRIAIKLPNEEITHVRLISYNHKQTGNTLATLRTSLILREESDYTPVYNPHVVTAGSNFLPPIKGVDGESAKYVLMSLSDTVLRYTYDGKAHENQQIIVRCDKSGIEDDFVLKVGNMDIPVGTDGVGIITPDMILTSPVEVRLVAGNFFDTKYITKILDTPTLNVSLSREQIRYYADGIAYADQDVTVTVQTVGLATMPVLTCNGIAYALSNNTATIPASVLLDNDTAEINVVCYDLSVCRTISKLIDTPSLRIDLPSDTIPYTADNVPISDTPIMGQVFWSGYRNNPILRIAGETVTYNSAGQFSFDPMILHDIDSCIISISINTDITSRTISKLVQSGDLDMTLSGSSFVFLPDGDMPKEDQPPIIVKVDKTGLASDIVLKVGDKIVDLVNGAYTIYADALIGNASLEVTAICGSITKTARISKIRDGGAGISFSIVTSGVSFKFNADMIPYPGQSISIWVEKSFASDARVEVEGIGVIINPTKDNPITVTPNDMIDDIMSITATGEGLTRSAMIVRIIDGQRGADGQSVIAQYSASETFEMNPAAEEVWFGVDWLGFPDTDVGFEPWSVMVPEIKTGQYLWRREGYAKLGELPSDWQYYCVINGYYQTINAQGASNALRSRSMVVTNIYQIDMNTVPRSSEGLEKGTLWVDPNGGVFVAL